jgi:hypothetical protein
VTSTPDLMTLQSGLRQYGCLQTRIEEEKRHASGMTPATNLSLNQLVQILVVNMNTDIHLMKIEVRLLEIIGIIKTFV